LKKVFENDQYSRYDHFQKMGKIEKLENRLNFQFQKKFYNFLQPEKL
jgi:hypothetical protein